MQPTYLDDFLPALTYSTIAPFTNVRAPCVIVCMNHKLYKYHELHASREPCLLDNSTLHEWTRALRHDMYESRNIYSHEPHTSHELLFHTRARTDLLRSPYMWYEWVTHTIWFTNHMWVTNFSLPQNPHRPTSITIHLIHTNELHTLYESRTTYESRTSLSRKSAHRPTSITIHLIHTNELHTLYESRTTC